MMLVQAWGISSATSWNFPAWSLSAEWAAYLLFPLLLLAGERATRGALAFGAAVAALVALVILMIAVGDSTLDHSWLLGLARCFLQFIAGAALWRAFDRGLFTPRHADAILLAGLAALAVVIGAPHLDLLAPFAFAAIVLACAMSGRLAMGAFANRAALFLGEISFSIYLSHAIVLSGSALVARSLGLAGQGDLVRLAFLAVVGLAILAVSVLGWRTIELPGQAAGRRLQRWLDTRAKAAGQPPAR